MMALLFCSFFFATLISVGIYIFYLLGIYTYVVKTSDMIGISKGEASENSKNGNIFLIGVVVVGILVFVASSLTK